MTKGHLSKDGLFCNVPDYAGKATKCIYKQATYFQTDNCQQPYQSQNAFREEGFYTGVYSKLWLLKSAYDYVILLNSDSAGRDY